MLPSGSVYATSSDVYLHGNTEFDGNYADGRGGEPTTTYVHISAIPS